LSPPVAACGRGYAATAVNVSLGRPAHPPHGSLCLLPNVTLLVSHSYEHLFCNWSAALLAVAAAPATAKIIKAIEMDDQIWEFMEVLFMDNQNRNSD
jgi:hypothetical protein